MTRRPLRPHFSSAAERELLERMERARYSAIMCGAAAGFGSRRHTLAAAVAKAIDALAADPTGDPSFYHAKSSARPASGT